MRQKWPDLLDTTGLERDTREVVLMKNGKKVGVFVIADQFESDEEVISQIRIQSEYLDGILERGEARRLVIPKGKNVVNIVV